MNNSVQMHQISSSSNSSNVRQLTQVHHQQQQIQDDNHQDNVRLNNGPNSQVNFRNQQSRISQFCNSKKTILKWIMVGFMMVFIIWLGSKLSSEIVKTRHPMFLSTFDTGKAPQVMSPQQSDYRSFKYYQKMVQLAKNTTAQNRQSTQKQIKQFDGISFKQFYNSYKVIRTIQLGKQYSKTQKQQQQLGPIIDQKNLDQYINKTQYFLDTVDQFQCSSCYSFPITATVQYMYKYYYNITVKLSEQQLIDCAHDDPNANGCDDGNITKGFQYVQKYGLVSTEEYPYRSITGNSFKCDQQIISKSKKSYKISGFRNLPMGNCQAIQSQLVKGNVVSAMINAGDLSAYTSGVFTDCKRFQLNHAITIVGQTQKNEWIIRNSWGKSFAQNGYFLMGHGNTCGVCSHAIVPVLKLNQKGQVLPYNPKQQKINKQ